MNPVPDFHRNHHPARNRNPSSELCRTPIPLSVGQGSNSCRTLFQFISDHAWPYRRHDPADENGIDLAVPGGVTSAQQPKGGRNGGNGVTHTAAAELSQKWSRQFSPGGILWGAAFLVALLSLAAVVTVSRQSDQQLQEANRAVTRTREVLEKLGELSTSLSEVESAARSFAISGKQSHLDPFYIAAKAVPADLKN